MAVYQGIQVYGGDIVSADDLNANIPTIYTKETATSRSSTTTLTNDPELQNIPLQVGAYEIELSLFWSQATATALMQTQWKFTGTWNSPIRICQGGGQTNAAPPNRATSFYTAGVGADTASAVYGSDNGSLYSGARELVRYAVVTAAGNLSLQWSQNVSTATNSNVLVGSTFYVRKISN